MMSPLLQQVIKAWAGAEFWNRGAEWQLSIVRPWCMHQPGMPPFSIQTVQRLQAGSALPSMQQQQQTRAAPTGSPQACHHQAAPLACAYSSRQDGPRGRRGHRAAGRAELSRRNQRQAVGPVWALGCQATPTGALPLFAQACQQGGRHRGLPAGLQVSSCIYPFSRFLLTVVAPPI